MREVAYHNAAVAALLDGRALTPEVLASLHTLLKASLAIPVTPRGFVSAAVRGVGEEKTGYDACWVRDTVWVHWALRHTAETSSEMADARAILDGLAAYFATPPQRRRMVDCIADPERAWHARDGAMQVPHIRFNPYSADLHDVYVAGEPQRWSHKQNDALGFFVWAAAEAWHDGFWRPSAEAEGTLALLVEYLLAVRFYDMADSGAWEEIEKINLSSVAFGVAALESWTKLGRGNARTAAGIEAGYARLLGDWPHESGAYPKDDPRYRRHDAAMLAILYPLALARLEERHVLALLENLAPLVGDVGIRRYLGDSYQCAGYWAEASTSNGHDSRTDDFSEAAKFLERAKAFRAGSEAQWFFDSWLATALAERFQRTGGADDRARAEYFFRRAAAQVTADGGSACTGADGKPVTPRAFPESYNVVFIDGMARFAPSPITPLNWAKASFRLALKSLNSALSKPLHG